MTVGTVPVAKVLPIFPTLVVHIENAVHTDLCNRILSYILRFKIKMAQNHTCLSGISKSSHTTESDFIRELDREIQPRFYDTLNDYQSRYREYYGMKPGSITNSWFNLQQRESVLKPHLHPDSEVSAALYINVDENSTPIVFHTPNPYTQYNSYARETEFTVDNIFIRPKIGDLILFPSWLSHSSNHVANQTLNRCVISFNS